MDALAGVAHSAWIGRRCLTSVSTVDAGGAAIGNCVWIGPGATMSSKLAVGDLPRITLGSQVTKNAFPR